MNCKKKSNCCGQPVNNDESENEIENNETRPNQLFEIKRQVLDKQTIDVMFPNKEYKRFYYKNYFKSSFSSSKVTKKCFKKQLYSRIPSIQWLKSYKLKFLLPDFIAGLVVGILHIPFGLALANLASLPPVFGNNFLHFTRTILN